MDNIWVGVIENRFDPLKLGRCQVRIIGKHTSNKTLIPTDSLPWAFTVQHLSDLNIKEGEFVVGLFLDGNDSQQPIILGVLQGIPDQLFPAQEGFSDPRTPNTLKNAPRFPKNLQLNSGKGVTITENAQASRYPNILNEPTISRLARNEKIDNTIIKTKKDSVSKSIPSTFGRVFDEPMTPYSAKYPYNHVIETESGHVIEVDDTVGAERIHIYHRSGTSMEMHPDGSKVDRIHGDYYEISLSDRSIYVSGDCSITAKGDINIKSGKDINMEAGGSLNIKTDKAIKLQSMEGITQWTNGPCDINGLPINLNGITPPPFGDSLGPMIKEKELTLVVSDLPEPKPTEPGNIVLEQRSGANVGDKKPNESSKQTATPVNIPKPEKANSEPVPTMTQSEGADVMIRALNRAKINDPIQRAMIYAQTSHESNGFTTLFENLRYTDKGLLKTWPSRFTSDIVSQYAKQPEKIANRAYANRMGNGDEASGDGWKYRGRGFIQLTGKENYLKASEAFNQDFVNYPDAVAVPDTAADIAVWYFQKGKNTGYRGSYSDISSVTKFVNGGLNGLEDRTAKFEVAKNDPTITTLKTELV